MSFSTKSIRCNLKLINKRYNSAFDSKTSSVEVALYSKLAILELSGWVEETIDIILQDYLQRTVQNDAIRNTIIKEVIQRVYGFKYKDYYRPLMERIIGAGNFQKIAKNLERVKQRNTHLQTILSDLTSKRDRAAHTHFQQGVTSCFDAPSWTITQLNSLVPLFRSIEGMIRRLK